MEDRGAQAHRAHPLKKCW